MVGVMGCFSGWPLATTAASTAAARDLHLMRQQQKTMTAKISSTMPPTHAIAIIAPLLSSVLVEDDPATDNMDIIIYMVSTLIVTTMFNGIIAIM